MTRPNQLCCSLTNRVLINDFLAVVIVVKISASPMLDTVGDMNTEIKNVENFDHKGPEGDHNMKSCLKMVEKFVLKPQREGGGMQRFFFLLELISRICRRAVTSPQYIYLDRP